MTLRKGIAFIVVSACSLVAGCAGKGPNSATPRTIDVTSLGALGDGTTLNTQTIQKAADELTGTGGTIIIPRGTFLTGAIFLKAGVNLQIDGILKGSTNTADYPQTETRIEGHFQQWCPALVNIDHSDGFHLTGHGTIQGGGEIFWDTFNDRYDKDTTTKNLDVYRPRNFYIHDSNNIVLQDVHFRDSGLWNVHVFRCQNVTINGLDIAAPYPSPSTDGIDVDSCQNVEIAHCTIGVNDDDIALKGNKGPDAMQATDVPSVQHIHIHDCTFGIGEGVVTLGSEATRVSDVLVEHCLVDVPADYPTTNILARLKIRPDTPQQYQNLVWRDITVHGKCDLLAIKAWTQYFDLKGQAPPVQQIDNVTLENITGDVEHFATFKFPKAADVDHVTLRHIDIKSGETPKKLTGPKELVVEDVKVNGVGE